MVNTGRYEGNNSRGSLLSLDFHLVPPMSDDHHGHRLDHDDDHHAGHSDDNGQQRLENVSWPNQISPVPPAKRHLRLNLDTK